MMMWFGNSEMTYNVINNTGGVQHRQKGSGTYLFTDLIPSTQYTLGMGGLQIYMHNIYYI